MTMTMKTPKTTSKQDDRLFINIANSGKTLPSGQWISVKDRLPECNTAPDSFGVQVLIWPHATFRGTSDSPTAFYGCRVTDQPSFYLYGAVLDSVEYWMPLPEGPK